MGILRLAVLAALVLISVEIGVRISGLTDVPLHRLGPTGYIPAPNQSGAVLHVKSWAYNERSMGVAQPFKPRGVLLIGDSVVNGGNSLRQGERLGPQLERIIGRDVWPVSAGGWGLANELAYIRAHPEVLHLDTIVFVLNSTDTVQGDWLGRYQMPTKRPLLASAFAWDRWVAKKKAIVPSRLPDWKPELADFLRRYRGRVVVVAYPVPNDFRSGSDPVAAVRGMVPEVIEVAPHWSADLYEEGVHPGARGTARLAEVIAAGLAR